MVFKHSCTIFSAVSAAPPMGSYCGHVYTETFLAKNGYFPLRMHLSFTQKQQKNNENKNEKALQSGNFENVFEPTVSVSTCKQGKRY